MSDRAIGMMLVSVAILLQATPTNADEPVKPVADKTDVLVYSATPGGIAAAITAAKHGHDVLLVEPTNRIGGLLTSGLSYSDFRSFEALGGTFRDFAGRVEGHYREKFGANSEQRKACRRGTQGEPHVNLLILGKMLAEYPNVRIVKQQILAGVELGTVVEGRRPLTALTLRSTEEGTPDRKITARFFIDASYEGDLMAMAGEPYHIGREARRQYGEALAGNENGEADGQVQGYNFRLVMTDDPANRVYPPAPQGYDRKDFAGVLPLFRTGRLKKVFDDGHGGIYRAHVPRMPNNKADVNDTPKAAARLSMPDINDAYPDGDDGTRKRICEQHARYNIGLLHFLQNDAEVPKEVREDARQWGLCKDEFVDSNHIPPRLYIREARRMVGQHVYTEGDTDSAPSDARAKLHPDSIAISDYILNCHGTGRTGTRFDGKHQGEFYKFVQPSQIPYGVIVPTRTTNLLVPVAVSASHVGFSMLRYECVWMSLGQASGHAAHLSLKHNTASQKVGVSELQALIHADSGITIYLADVLPGSKDFTAVQWLGSHGFFHGLHDTKGKPLPKPKSLGGQYNEAFPFHAVEMGKLLDVATEEKWRRLAASLKSPVAPSAEFIGLSRGVMLRAVYQNRPK